MVEIWDLYDKDRVKLNQTMKRGDEFLPDTYHLAVHVCIFNSKGEMLIQQRQPFKEGWPNMWDITVGGSAVAGDNSQVAAEREVLEEIGYELSLEGIRPSLTINFKDGFDDIYLVEREVDLSTLTLQPEEVQAVKWATRHEIFELIEQGLFIPYHESLIELLFNIRNQLGCHKKRAN